MFEFYQSFEEIKDELIMRIIIIIYYFPILSQDQY